MQRIEFELTPERPYCLEESAARLVRFSQLVDHLDDGCYRRCLTLGGDLALLEARQLGSAARAVLRIAIVGDFNDAVEARRDAEAFVRRSLGAGCKLRPFYRAMKDDRLLADSIKAHHGMALCGGATLFEAIVTAILAQQINLAFAYSIYDVLTRRYGEKLVVDGTMYRAFPTAQRMSKVRESTLRTLRLTAAKAGTIHRMAKAFAVGELVQSELQKLDDEDVIERLVTYKGIGRWTAETALIRGLGRVDVFPAGDLGVVKKIAIEMLGRSQVAKEAEMRAFSERWRPHRSLALIYAYAVLYGGPAKGPASSEANP
ncbi:MAG: DNA-3-methyladenine glycosylase II [Myxococcota bacterium]|jgi:DNA-3-methyladenine glycosylase II